MADAKKDKSIIEDEELIRRCATVLSKKKDKLEIMDLTSFESFKAVIDEELLEQAELNDQVTYVKSGDYVKILEIRKQ